MRRKILYTGIKKYDYAIRNFDNHLRLSGRSLSTRSVYNNTFRLFLERARKLPENCTQNEIIDTIISLQEERGFQSSTLKHFVFSMKYYLTKIVDRNDLVKKIRIPKTKRYDIEVLNADEIIDLFGACRNSRDLMVLQLLYEAGIRIQELLNLRISDIDMSTNSLRILNSKNGNSRVVHIGCELSKRISNYLRAEVCLFKRDLFFRDDSDKFIKLSRGGIRFMLRSTVKRANIRKRATPHLLRHAFAVHYLNFGGSIYQLRRLLGHKNLKTTLHYLQYAVLPPAGNLSILDKLMSKKEEINYAA